jgi:ribose transport system permease protein
VSALPPKAERQHPACVSRRSAWGHLLTQNVGLLFAATMLGASIVTYCALYYAQRQKFPGAFVLTSTIDNTMPLVFAAAAQTIVVLTRGLDLSVGGIMDLTNAIAAITLGATPVTMIGWSMAILLIGAGLGLVNGVLVAIGRLQPILVTLATLAIFQGLAIRVLPEPGGSVPDLYTTVLVNTNYPFSLLYLALLGILWFVFRRTSLGVAIIAIGNDEAAARGTGINPVRTKIAAYVLSGALSACGGLFLAAMATGGDATTGNGFTLTSVVAVVLGGVSLSGGRGSVIGAVMGAFVTTMIVNILFFSHVEPLYQAFYEGAFLVIAVVLAKGVGRLVGRSG